MVAMSKELADPRGVANLILDEGDRKGINISHAALQKLLYFSHGLWLISNGRPLVSGYFEAWTYGPVHPAVFNAFRSFRSEPINARAMKHNLLNGTVEQIDVPYEDRIRFHVEKVVLAYGGLSVGRLIQLSHARGGPWDYVVNEKRTSGVLGLRISDRVIVERFKHHKMSLGVPDTIGNPDEDSPLA